MNKQQAKRTKKIRQGDKVLVIAGNDKGQIGTVLSFKENNRVIVQGVNMRKKHMRKSQQAPNGNILSIEAPVHISNLRLCTDDEKPIKVSVQVDSEGTKHLVYAVDGEKKIYRTLKKREG